MKKDLIQDMIERENAKKMLIAETKQIPLERLYVNLWSYFTVCIN